MLLSGLVCLAGGEKRGIDVRFSPGFCLIIVHTAGKKPWRVSSAGNCIGSIVVLPVLPSPVGQPPRMAEWEVTAVYAGSEHLGKA